MSGEVERDLRTVGPRLRSTVRRGAAQTMTGALSNPIAREVAPFAALGPAGFPLLAGAAPFLPNTGPVVRGAAEEAPGVAGALVAEATVAPNLRYSAADREVGILERMRDAGFATQEDVDEAIRARDEAGTWALGNAVLFPFDAALLAKGGMVAARQLPRLRGPSAPRAAAGAPATAAVPPLAPRQRRPTRAQARAAAALQEWEAGRPIRQLEREFGDLTAGERAGDPYAMSREMELRRAGAGQETMRGFDEARSEQMQDRLMRRIATRGLEPQNPDVASAGNTLVDQLRTQYDDLRDIQREWYDEAFRLGADDAIAPTDELLDTVLANSREHFGRLDDSAIAIIRDLHEEIAAGQATYARVERARQALNAELRTAMASGDGRRVDAIHRIIDDLDAFAEPRVSEPTRQAILEARAITKEIGDMYGQQLRPELATGHIGRRDLGGQILRQLRETDLADEAVINRVFGAGAKPSQATFSTVRRVAENARRQLATEGIAPTGASTGQSQRLAGRQKIGGRTKGERTFEPTPAETARFGTELPRADLQALREAWTYRLVEPLKAGSPVPFGELATRLRHALTSSRSTTEQMFNAREIATLERALKYMEQATLPKGAYMPSAPGIAEAALQRGLAATIGRLFDRIGLDVVGDAIRTGIVNARQVREARAAIARPTIPRLAVRGRLQRMTGQRTGLRRVQPPPAVGAAPPPLAPPAAAVAAPRGYRRGNRPGPGMTPQAEGRSGIPGRGPDARGAARATPRLSEEQRAALSPDQSYAIERRMAGLNNRDIAEEMQTSAKAVAVQISNGQRRLRNAGLAVDAPTQRLGRPRDEITERVAELREQGLDNAAIMERLGLTRRELESRLNSIRSRGGSAAGLLTGAGTAGALGLGAGGEAEAQEASPELTQVRRDLQALRSDMEVIERASRTEAPEDVKAAQRILRRAGFYSGRIDGQWRGLTTAANNQFQPQLAAQVERLEERRTELEEEDVGRRLRASPELAAARELGPAGAFWGALGVMGAARYGGNLLRNRRLNRLVATRPSLSGSSPETMREAAARQADINAFALEGLEGSARQNLPYTRAPNSPLGFKPRPRAASAADLYSSSFAQRFNEQTPYLAGSAIAGVITYPMLHAAEAELAAAQEAYDGDRGNEEKFRRLEAARNQVAILQTALRAELGIGAGALGGVLHGGFRPNVRGYERARTEMDQYLQVGRRAPPQAPP